MAEQQAGMHPDPEHPGLMRWWDGSQWTDRRATPIYAPALDDIRKDVRFVKTVMVWWVILTVLGVGLIILDSI